MSKGSGILEQIKNGDHRQYETLSLETLDKFLKDLSEKPAPRELTVMVTDFQSRLLSATIYNDTVELEKLNREMLEKRIIRLKNLSSFTNVDYDLIYLLSSAFDLKTTFGSDVVWGIETKYLGEDEYDDSYETTQIRWEDGRWFLEVYGSECQYDYKQLSCREISEREVFDLILKK